MLVDTLEPSPFSSRHCRCSSSRSAPGHDAEVDGLTNLARCCGTMLLLTDGTVMVKVQPGQQLDAPTDSTAQHQRDVVAPDLVVFPVYAASHVLPNGRCARRRIHSNPFDRPDMQARSIPQRQLVPIAPHPESNFGDERRCHIYRQFCWDRSIPRQLFMRHRLGRSFGIRCNDQTRKIVGRCRK
jgi:hypothetical protein